MSPGIEAQSGRANPDRVQATQPGPREVDPRKHYATPYHQL